VFFALELVIAVVLFAIMVLTGVDVVGRYVFSRPISGADELIGAGMAILIFGSLPLVALRDEQITIDTVSGLMRGAVKAIQARLVHLASALILGYLAYRLFAIGEKMARTGEHSSLLHIPHGVLAYVLAVMAAISALVTLVLVFRRRA
jgi:TRAP-type C4-dicarboxylate transport system permease small subunit